MTYTSTAEVSSVIGKPGILDTWQRIAVLACKAFCATPRTVATFYWVLGTSWELFTCNLFRPCIRYYCPHFRKEEAWWVDCSAHRILSPWRCLSMSHNPAPCPALPTDTGTDSWPNPRWVNYILPPRNVKCAVRLHRGELCILKQKSCWRTYFQKIGMNT